MKTLKYILIDPYLETVTEGSFDYSEEADELLASMGEQLNSVIGSSHFDRVCFDDDSHDIVIDDEGHWNHPGGVKKFFSCFKYAQAHLIAGRGIVVGNIMTEDGVDWGDAKLSLEDVKAETVFYDKNSALHEASRLDKLWEGVEV